MQSCATGCLVAALSALLRLGGAPCNHALPAAWLPRFQRCCDLAVCHAIMRYRLLGGRAFSAAATWRCAMQSCATGCLEAALSALLQPGGAPCNHALVAAWMPRFQRCCDLAVRHAIMRYRLLGCRAFSAAATWRCAMQSCASGCLVAALSALLQPGGAPCNHALPAAWLPRFQRCCDLAVRHAIMRYRLLGCRAFSAAATWRCAMQSCATGCLEAALSALLQPGGAPCNHALPAAWRPRFQRCCNLAVRHAIMRYRLLGCRAFSAAATWRCAMQSCATGCLEAALSALLQLGGAPCNHALPAACVPRFESCRSMWSQGRIS